MGFKSYVYITHEGNHMEEHTRGKQTEDYYQIESDKYDKKRFVSPIGQYIDDIEKLMVLKNLKPGNVLELCCGTGRFATFLCKKGHPYSGVDFTKNMLDQAKEKNKDCKELTFKLLDVKDLGKELPHNSFDNIFVARAIKFWQTPQQVIDDSYKLLKEEGRIVLCFQGKDRSLSGILMNLNQKTQDKHIFLRSHKVGTEKYYDSKEIIKMMKESGFKIVSKHSYFNFAAYTWFMQKFGRIPQKILARFFRIFDNHFNYGWRTVIVGVKK
jgi:ubiquinone/menaquinone biosynthesis C-methylase UbiE